MKRHRPTDSTTRYRQWVFFAMLVISLCWGCSGEEAAVPDSIRNPQLGMSFTRLPEGFDVAANEGRELRLEANVEGREGTMWVEVGERSDYGIDLVAVVNSQKELYEARPSGEYSGGRQMVTPAGQAYYARGSFDREGARFEETRVFLLHPLENSLVTFHYEYAAGDDSAERLPELFSWIGELETEPTDGDSATSPSQP